MFKFIIQNLHINIFTSANYIKVFSLLISIHLYQVSDWNQRHKVVCKEAKKRYNQTKDVSKMIQKLSDLSLTGQLSGDSPLNNLAALLQGAKENEAVKERRKYLKKEKKRYQEGLKT